MIAKGTAQTSHGVEKRGLGEETVRIAENSMGIVLKNDEVRGKNIETKRDVEEELRLEWWRNSLEKQSFVLERRRNRPEW